MEKINFFKRKTVLKKPNLKDIAAIAAAVSLGLILGFGGGLKTAEVKQDKVAACVADKFVLAVGQAEGYLAMYPERALREMIANAQVGDLEKKRFSDALDYAKEHGEGSGLRAFTECLNK